MNTASEQFVEDYLLVILNDQSSWNDLMARARDHKLQVIPFAESLREEWDDYVYQLYTQASKVWGDDAPASLIIRQMMGGWGATEFESIARQLINQQVEAMA